MARIDTNETTSKGTFIYNVRVVVQKMAIFSYFILLIIEGCSMVQQTIWPRNHTSHTKVYFNEFVANVLRGNIGIVNFDL